MQDVKWQVRKAKLGDAKDIVRLARGSNEFLMPYVLNEFVVNNYLSQFLVAEKIVYEPIRFELGGAVHYISNPSLGNDEVGILEFDKTNCFLYYVKQVPEDIIEKFVRSRSKVAFLGQIVCPGKGSFYSILEELKSQYNELWCWMSIVGPSYKSYERYGFKFSEQREFWNAYKCDYSTFVLGKWGKEETNED